MEYEQNEKVLAEFQQHTEWTDPYETTLLTVNFLAICTQCRSYCCTQYDQLLARYCRLSTCLSVTMLTAVFKVKLN